MQAIHINSFEMEPIAHHGQPRKFQKVFMVDNNTLDSLNNAELLSKRDFAEELTLFNSSSAALECITNTRRLNDVPDLVFLNLDLNGFEFLSRFSELNDFTRKRCKIVILSSGSNEKDRKKCLMNRSVVQYFPKQLNDRMLEQFIN
jgi:CheY-like chemotaxis protein